MSRRRGFRASLAEDKRIAQHLSKIETNKLKGKERQYKHIRRDYVLKTLKLECQL